MNRLLQKATERSIRYIDNLEDRIVFPSSDAVKKLSQFEELLPEELSDPETVLEMLDNNGSTNIVQRRYLNGSCAMLDSKRNDIRGIYFSRRNASLYGKSCSGTHGLSHGHTSALCANTCKCHSLRRHDPTGYGNP